MMPLKSYQRDDATKTAVDHLEELLEKIYPEPSPDIFTLDDFTYRYPLTGLGDLATREIEQALRINAGLNNYTQIGLCEFHIGLIFLYWGDFRGAMAQFDSARRKWGFSGSSATTSLCYFGKGLTNFLALHYEEALRCYGLAEQALIIVDVKRNESYCKKIGEYIQEAQINAREAIRTLGQKRNGDGSAQEYANIPPDQNSPDAVPYIVIPATPPTSSSTAQTAPPFQDYPVVLPEPKPEESSEASNSASADTSSGEPRATSDEPTALAPIPAHKYDKKNHEWYQVKNEIGKNFFPDLVDGDWLLVQKTPAIGTQIRADEPILIGIEVEDEFDGAILIQSKSNTVSPRIYLAKYDDPVGTFIRDTETGEVTFFVLEKTIKVGLSSQDRQISVQWSAIIGIVVGFWRAKRRT